ncbi:hypothetical protein SERLA73DRAFT_77506 [Serpula lacrymans var. lacrymans S7.3]|uniref:CCHC-type domain-containing protein n=2 Tax=Serpula lacrymans var. lacrymans TaxID=341189 RepID=F8QAH5_SERL3|nr:uncharacterized protein SERLADRAFT_442377 [Serpula lacrymans var. lacrymans S7.9]EGN94765.1 hypothetical protein SERLA73DRAFT_77506 [Serpula lacrymans var. lacrymans S7.3]EGO20242.1 hypothetical protein SERLADRAFT_442377 [Serpula lacrymans var. lacrymans S7.9]
MTAPITSSPTPHYNLRTRSKASGQLRRASSESSLSNLPDSPPGLSPRLSPGGQAGSAPRRPSRSYSDVVRTGDPLPDLKTRRREAEVNSLKLRTGTRTGAPRTQTEVPPVARPSGVTTLDTQQDTLVQQAEKLLSDDQLKTILKRREIERAARQSETATNLESQEGTKGKGTDPANWGGLDIEETELEPEAQREALRAWNKAHEWASLSHQEVPGPSGTKRNQVQETSDQEDTHQEEESRTRTSRRRSKIRYRKERQKQRRHDKREIYPSSGGDPRVMGYRDPIVGLMERALKPMEDPRRPGSIYHTFAPANQVGSTSYIGRALGQMTSQRQPDPPSDSSDSSSSDSDSDQSSLSSETSSVSSLGQSRGRGHRGRKRKNCKSKRKRSPRRPILKPTEPQVYDGRPDSQEFHQFMVASSTYLKEGRVPRKGRVYRLSSFLRGTAYDFFLYKVSPDPSSWDLKDFFIGLFNHCFPVDYRMKQRDKLKRCFQDHKSVREYLYELTELWNIIGDVDERQRVIRFWTGLNTELQQGLWLKELNPEISRFEEVQSAAEVLELARSAGLRGRSSQMKVQSSHDNRNPTAYSKHEVSNKRANQGDTRRPPLDKARGPAFGGNRTHPQTKSRPLEARREAREKKAPVLSTEEREKHVAEGRCFICHELGHFSRNCPHRNAVSSQRKDRPPGIPNFAMGID